MTKCYTGLSIAGKGGNLVLIWIHAFTKSSVRIMFLFSILGLFSMLLISHPALYIRMLVPINDCAALQLKMCLSCT